MAHDTTVSVEPGEEPARLRVEVDGPRFRVRTATFATPWLPDTPSPRHLTLVWCRLLVGAHGRPLCTLPEWAGLVGRTNRQAASQHLEEVRQCGAEMRAFVLRQRKVDTTGVEGVLPERLQTPWAGPTALVPRVQARLARQDVSGANMECAVAQISCVPVRRTRRRQLETGTIQSHEAALLAASLESLAAPSAQPPGGGGPPVDGGLRIADPTALAALVTPDVPLAQGSGSLCWLTFRMTLVSWHGPLSVLGRWCGVHTTTIRRWVLGLALALWPRISRWIGERVTASMVDVEEPWRTIRGRWYDWFVVLAVPTELPVLAALLPSRSPWACRGVGRQRRQLNTVPQVLITDGLPAYASLVPGAKHVWCRLHHQQGVTHGLPQHCATEAASNARTPRMKRLFHTRDQRTVRRRLTRLKEQATALESTPWVTAVEAKRPQLICRVGSVRRPSTSNAVDRFFRAFQRCYRTRGGVHSGLSATRELRLFLVVSVFTQHATTGQAPIEGIVPEARSMPLYRLVNDPFRALQEWGDVKLEGEMADLLTPQEAVA
jgi:transposase-like protein